MNLLASDVVAEGMPQAEVGWVGKLGLLELIVGHSELIISSPLDVEGARLGAFCRTLPNGHIMLLISISFIKSLVSILLLTLQWLEVALWGNLQLVHIRFSLSLH